MTTPGQWIRNGFVGPNYGQPTAPVADDWIQPKIPVQRSICKSGGECLEIPRLTRLTAYEQNPTLRIAGARVLEGRAGQAIAVGNMPQTHIVQPGQSQLQHARDRPFHVAPGG